MTYQNYKYIWVLRHGQAKPIDFLVASLQWSACPCRRDMSIWKNLSITTRTGLARRQLLRWLQCLQMPRATIATIWTNVEITQKPRSCVCGTLWGGGAQRRVRIGAESVYQASADFNASQGKPCVLRRSFFKFCITIVMREQFPALGQSIIRRYHGNMQVWGSLLSFFSY